MLIIGIEGTQLTVRERQWLRHPALSGVILFTRNFADRAQVTGLIEDIRGAAERPLLLAVDQEGGTVQRFRSGFTRLPELAQLGQRYREDAGEGLDLARRHGWLMASEMRAVGIDISFAPVVDLARGNRCIGTRAFAAEPEAVAALTVAYIEGMREAGMAATLKHFPGHGSVLGDTHVDVAEDPRALENLRQSDLLPFAAGINAGAEAVMMAHVRYRAVAPEPAGYSRRWIGDVLRGELGFGGIVVSDDIGMAAAHSAGGVAARVQAHLDAGCDLVLACAPGLVPEALAAVADRRAESHPIAVLNGRKPRSWDALTADARWQAARVSLGIAD